jgi:hypothetical protein
MERDIEQHLVNWNLFKAYGEFNIKFEGIVDRFRKLLIDLVKKYYGFEVDWEDENTDRLPEYMQDRLLKIILHDDGAMAIIEKCRSCFMDSTSQEVVSILKANQINPINLNIFDIQVAELLFKKAIQLVNVRNILIHTNFNEDFFGWNPLTELKGAKDKKIAKGFKEVNYIFVLTNLELFNEQMEKFYLHIRKLQFAIYNEEENFNENDLNEITAMVFQIETNS